MKKISIITYFIILLLITTYQDFILVNKYGEFFRTTIPFFLPIFVLVEIIYLIKNKRIKITKIQLFLLLFIIVNSCISIMYVFYYFMNGTYVFLGENIFVKFINGIIYLLVLLLYMRNVYFIFNNLAIKYILNSFLIAISFLNAILLLEYFSLPNAFTSIHSVSQEYNRIRLLTAESSWTGTIYVVYCGIALYLSNKTKKRVKSTYIILSFLTFGMLSGSKGFILSALLSFIPFVFKKTNLKTYIAVIGVLAIACLAWISYFSDIFMKHFLSDIENYTSVSTRLGLVLSVIRIIIFHPFGVGTGTFTFMLDENIPKIFPWLDYLFTTLFNVKPNFSELLNILGSTQGLSAKSGFFQWMLTGGVFSLVYFIITLRYMKNSLNGNIVLLYCLYFLVISVVFYINLEIKYEIWLFIAFIDYIGKNGKRLNVNP